MLLIRLFSFLPFRLLYLLSDFIFLITYYIIRYRRKVVRKNLKRSFPDKSKKDLKIIEKIFYKNLCDYAVEMIKLSTISKDDLARRMNFPDMHLIEKYKNANQCVLILASHQFNWEWLLTAGSFSLPLSMDFVYQPVHNGFFNKFSLYCRTRFGAYAIKRDEVARETIKRRHLLRGVAIVADQYPGLKKDKKYFTTFLNQETVFFQAANQLALVTQYPVVFAAIKKVRRGYYEASFVSIAEPPYEKDDFAMIENYVRAVEKVIQDEPAGWLWSHNRWKKRHLQHTAGQDRS